MRDDHSSGTRLAARLARPTRTAERECSCALRRGRPYSVLLPVGFTLPPLLPGARCALAAPFRPCPRGALRHLARAVCFLWHFPWGRPRRGLSGTVFPWSPDFPLPLARQRPSGRLAGNRCAAGNEKARVHTEATEITRPRKKARMALRATRVSFLLGGSPCVLGGLRVNPLFRSDKALYGQQSRARAGVGFAIDGLRPPVALERTQHRRQRGIERAL